MHTTAETLEGEFQKILKDLKIEMKETPVIDFKDMVAVLLYPISLFAIGVAGLLVWS